MEPNNFPAIYADNSLHNKGIILSMKRIYMKAYVFLQSYLKNNALLVIIALRY